MLDCPACAGPTALGGGCATCNGTTQVSQEAYDLFIRNQAIQHKLFELQTLIGNVLLSAETSEELKQAIAEIVTN